MTLGPESAAAVGLNGRFILRRGFSFGIRRWPIASPDPAGFLPGTRQLPSIAFLGTDQAAF